MSDEAVRDLERRARANPEDFAAGHALVRALERAGDRAGAAKALRRLARAGDREASRTLELWRPPFPSAGPTTRSGLDAARARIVRRETLPMESTADVVAASDSVLILRDGAVLVALDARTFEERWRTRQMAEHVLVGSVLIGARGHRVWVRDVESGRRLRAFDAPGHVDMVGGERDRFVLLVSTPGGQRLVGHALEGPPVWSAPLAERAWHLSVAGERVVTLGWEMLGKRTALEGRDLVTGERAFVHEFEGAVPHPLATDPLGMVLEWRDHVIEFELDEGKDRRFESRLEYDPANLARLAGSDLLVQRPNELELLDRSTGKSRWRAPIDRGHASHVALAGEHVWFASAPEALEVRALGIADGLGVLRRQVELERPAESVNLVPLDGALLVVVADAEAFMLLRFEARQARDRD